MELNTKSNLILINRHCMVVGSEVWTNWIILVQCNFNCLTASVTSEIIVCIKIYWMGFWGVVKTLLFIFVAFCLLWRIVPLPIKPSSYLFIESNAIAFCFWYISIRQNIIEHAFMITCVVALLVEYLRNNSWSRIFVFI